MSTSTLFDVADRVAIVTDGNGGIGRDIALGLARAGAAVAIIGRNEDKNQLVLNELQEIGNPALALRVDLSHRNELEPALDRIESELGPAEILVNNAGIVSLSGGVLEESAEDLDSVVETQLKLRPITFKSMLLHPAGSRLT